jgi:hypothetical protein
VAYGVSIGSLQDPDTPFARAFDDAQATIQVGPRMARLCGPYCTVNLGLLWCSVCVQHRFKTPGWRIVKWFKPREWKLRSAVKVRSLADALALRVVLCFHALSACRSCTAIAMKSSLLVAVQQRRRVSKPRKVRQWYDQKEKWGV